VRLPDGGMARDVARSGVGDSRCPRRDQEGGAGRAVHGWRAWPVTGTGRVCPRDAHRAGRGQTRWGGAGSAGGQSPGSASAREAGWSTGFMATPRTESAAIASARGVQAVESVGAARPMIGVWRARRAGIGTRQAVRRPEMRDRARKKR